MKLHKMWRLIHGVARQHRWDLTLDGPDDTSVNAAVVYECRPCQIRRPIPPPAGPFDPCFCRDATCDGWLAYIAHFVDIMGVEPDDIDIAMDQQLYASRDALIRAYGTFGSPTPFLTALVLAEREGK